MTNSNSEHDIWPALPFKEWSDTLATLHMWTQIVGKIRLVQSPWLNHSWHTALYLTSRGMTTLPISFGSRTFQIDFDFIDHRLVITTSDGSVELLELKPRTVADFYADLFERLSSLGLEVEINRAPNEVANPIPFDVDKTHASYDPLYANRFWRVLVQVDRVFKQFRARFIGKCSPIHFFWGSFDMAVTRFSGREAPQHPGGVPNLPDWVTREAYSHEVSSAGFWPGNEQMPEAIFYAYAYPEPQGFSSSVVGPEAAFYSKDFKEFVLPYEAVRNVASPDEAILEFLQTTYEAAANNGYWPRSELERDSNLFPL